MAKTEPDKATGRTDVEITVGNETNKSQYIKLGYNAMGLIMTSPSKETQDEILSRVSLPDTVQTVEEKLQLFSRFVAMATGISIDSLEGKVPQIGFNISNLVERQILFAVLKTFSETNYKGDKLKPAKKERTIKIMNQSPIGGGLENIDNIPVWKVNLPTLVKLSGYNPDSKQDTEKVAASIVKLAKEQYFLLWTRMKRDDHGRPIKNKKTGSFEFEPVSRFDSVLDVNFVLNEKGKLNYYEISPSPVFLDEITAEYGGGKNGHFVLIPYDDYKEIQGAFYTLNPTKKRVPPLVSKFCWVLRVWARKIQGKIKNSSRSNKRNGKGQEASPSNVINITYESLCQELNVPESLMKGQRKRTRGLIEESIQVAKQAGYITDGNLNEENETYTFVLNMDFYPQSFDK